MDDAASTGIVCDRNVFLWTAFGARDHGIGICGCSHEVGRRREMNMVLAVLVFYPFLGGLLSYAAGGYKEDLRDYLADFIVVSEFALMLFLALQSRGSLDAQTMTELYVPGVCGFGLRFTLDGFRVVYGLVAALMWMMTTVFPGNIFGIMRTETDFICFFC